MRKIITRLLASALLLSVAFSMSGCSLVAKGVTKELWYKGTLKIYKEGLDSGWANEKDIDVFIADELKDPNNDIGYLLIDLDEDGTKELLIGFNDGSTYTKFTDLYVYHRDMGAYQIMHGTAGSYIYLAYDNVIISDSSFGTGADRTYMTWDSTWDEFTSIDGEGKYLPIKWDLTEF